jgi:hypothetical protein
MRRIIRSLDSAVQLWPIALQPRFCKKCVLPKPDRAHHCSLCQRCVLKMDHHCPWINNCVSTARLQSLELQESLVFLGVVVSPRSSRAAYWNSSDRDLPIVA